MNPKTLECRHQAHSSPSSSGTRTTAHPALDAGCAPVFGSAMASSTASAPSLSAVLLRIFPIQNLEPSAVFSLCDVRPEFVLGNNALQILFAHLFRRAHSRRASAKTFL